MRTLNDGDRSDSTEVQLLRLDHVAKRLSISLRLLRNLIDEGRLPVVRMGRRVAVHPDDLDALIASLRTPVAKKGDNI
jgi:excisionase family DNA binding protein